MVVEGSWLSAWFWGERQWGDVWEECRSYSLRGLVEDWLQRSEINEDGAPLMETIGQSPGSCEKMFGLWGNSESELVWASEEWLGRRHGFFPDQSSEKSRTEPKRVRRKAVFGPGRSLGKSGVDVGKVAGDWVLLWLGSPAPSGYGEDGVHSREAAEKKTEDRKDFKKLMKENNRKEVWRLYIERKGTLVVKKDRSRKIRNGKKGKNKMKTEEQKEKQWQSSEQRQGGGCKMKPSGVT